MLSPIENGSVEHGSPQNEDITVSSQGLEVLKASIDRGFDRLDASIDRGLDKIDRTIKWIFAGVFVLMVISLAMAWNSNARVTTPIGGFEVFPRLSSEQGSYGSSHRTADQQHHQAQQAQ